VVFYTPNIVQLLATGIANALGVHLSYFALRSAVLWTCPLIRIFWRIEKRLYKLYDFRLPMPLPINWIAVFAGITIPYILLLIAIGLPFKPHPRLAVYSCRPGVLTWGHHQAPSLESKRLPELVESQVSLPDRAAPPGVRLTAAQREETR